MPATRLRRTFAGWIAALVLVALPHTARANDFDQFQNARVAYESQNYELAADLFRGILSDAGTDNSPLVVESRKYLAATYLFLGRKADAEAEIEKLLQNDPDYVLDPLAFPAEFAKTFAQVQQRLTERRKHEAAQTAEQAAAAAAKSQLEKQREQERLKRLVELASTQRVERLRSRWIALLPFGVGQFQNDDNGLGLFFAISEGALLASGLITFAIHESLRDEHDLTPENLNKAEIAESSSRWINQISLALLGAVAVTGVIEAQLSFKPSESFDRPRPLPPDLKGLQLSVGPGSLHLTGHF